MRMVILLLMLSVWMGCQSETYRSQPSPLAKADSLIVGGGCETCEYMYIGQPAEIDAVDTSEGWREPGQKLVVKGRVLQIDGKTPAAGILLYYWQTDHAGLYSYRSTMPDGVRRHGHIRGWLRTDAEGRYTLYTARPAPYPNSNIAAHIHMVVKEPGMSEYYIDDYEFDDDKLLTGVERKKRSSRGGTGVLRAELVKGVQVAERNIILGLNIPDHPAMKAKPKTIGLAVGEEQPSFIPFHAWGSDKGSRACPVCKYGRYQGIIYFLGANPNWDEVKKWLTFLEKLSIQRKLSLKVYFVYGNSKAYKSAIRDRELSALGAELGLSHLAITYVPSFADADTEIDRNKLNGLSGSVFIVYKEHVITDKFIDLKPTQENMLRLNTALNP
jgi:protocatechuate 3,4-dioxygenase, beta subunit